MEMDYEHPLFGKIGFSREGQKKFYKIVSGFKRNVDLANVSEEEKKKHYDTINKTLKKFEELKYDYLNQQIRAFKEENEKVEEMSDIEEILEEQEGKLLN